MNESTILKYTLDSLLLVLALSMPPILAATIFGVLVAVFQAVTQVQEQVLGFSIKLVAVIITMVFTANWMGIELIQYARQLFTNFAGIV